MRTRLFILFLFVLIPAATQAQIKAKAISYTLEVDLSKFSKNNDEVKGKVCKYEVDAYYTDSKLRTIVRIISRPENFDLTIMQRLYDLTSKDEYNINHENSYIALKKDQDFKPKSTGKQKTILGHACKEYTFKDYRDITFSVWVAEKLSKNICPAGNFSLKGTALEVTSSSGLHFVATDMAEGEVDSKFFELPQGYQQETISPPAKK